MSNEYVANDELKRSIVDTKNVLNERKPEKVDLYKKQVSTTVGNKNDSSTWALA